MRRLFIPACVLGLPLLVAACGADAPPSPRLADREACSAGATAAVDKTNAKRALTWFAAPVTRWGQVDDNRDACMAAKGWGRTRACTDEERRQGSKVATRTVTADGVRCTEPDRPVLSIRS